ncbi:MAG: DNA/RNA nuclease SfsA [Clostridiales bacterium]|nr:DNA/RNA nuclease SfsA [Clostridiales bacterium]
MKYQKVVKATFLRRPNRFVAFCMLNDEEVRCHVPNTGRCRELLIPGRTVYLAMADNPNRATKYSLIGVDKDGLMVNMDSGAPNRAVEEAIYHIPFPGMGKTVWYKRECKYKDSRFDFMIKDESGKEGFVEVKGVTLFDGTAARFPDAPTVRGVRHIHELMGAVKEGYCAYILFVIQGKGLDYVAPNDAGGTEFGDALRLAAANGVVPLAYDCTITPDEMTLDAPIPVVLSEQ